LRDILDFSGTKIEQICLSAKDRTIRTLMSNKWTLLIACIFLILCVYLKEARARAGQETKSALQPQGQMLSNVAPDNVTHGR
jgi:hypothetical protein